VLYGAENHLPAAGRFAGVGFVSRIMKAISDML